MKFEKLKIYGVTGLNNSKTLTRTDDAVGLTYNKTTETVPPHLITSDFDTCYPWCDMQEVNLDGNIFIKIPKFYAKYTKVGNGYKCQISGCRYEGFSTLFIDGKGNEIDYVLVGKYPGTLGLSSNKDHLSSRLNNGIPPTFTDISEVRQKCAANGSGFQNYDFLIHEIIKLLFTVEFATTDSKSILDSTSEESLGHGTMGYTAKLTTPSGVNYEGQTYITHMKYRGIEDLWGGSFTYLCDGIITDTSDGIRLLGCTNPASYNNVDSYFTIGAIQNSYGQRVTKIEPSTVLPLICLTVDTNASSSSYFPNAYFYPSTSSNPMYVGGRNFSIWSQWFTGAGETTYSGLARLCYKPIEG